MKPTTNKTPDRHSPQQPVSPPQLTQSLVSYNLEGTELLLPASHRLPFFRSQFPFYASNVGRIAAAVYDKYQDMTCIDIGANVGDTVAFLRAAAHFPILCIEGDEQFSAILALNIQRANLTDVYLERAFVGNQTMTAHSRLQTGDGTGHLVADETGTSSIDFRTLADIIVGQPLFAMPRMVKVDTDGYDCQILSGSIDLLARAKPVIFFEYDPYFFSKAGWDGYSIFDQLAGIGYHSVMVYENIGEYLLTARLEDRQLLTDLHHFYSGRYSNKYCDLCAFHAQDKDLGALLRLREHNYFNRIRSRAPGR